MKNEARESETWWQGELAFARHLLAAGRIEAAEAALEGLAKDAGTALRREGLAPLFAEAGRARFRSEHYAQSADALGQALALDPGLQAARLDLGFALFNLDRTEEALLLLAAIPDDAPEKPAAWRAQAAALINAQSFAEAKDALARALASDPADAESWSLLLQLHYALYEVALRFRDWTRANLAQPEARPNLLPEGLAPEALREIMGYADRVRALDRRIRVEEMGFRFLVAAGQPEEALAFLKADLTPDARTFRLMADGAWLLRDLAAAQDFYRQNLALRCLPPAPERPLGLPIPARAKVPDGLPIVYVHWDAPDYFRLSLARSRITNPASKVVVIGDSSNRFQGLDHVPLASVGQGAAAFQTLYRHQSENDYCYELFCFQRWFFLRDWMRSHGVPRLCALDSDVLLYAGLEELSPRLEGHDLAFAGPLGAHFAILTLAGVEALCDFFTGLYQNPAALPATGQVSDMLLLPRFLKGRNWADLGLGKEQPAIDGNLRLAEGFKMAEGMKAIAFDEKGQPWGEREEGGKVRFAALHFQGTAKRIMKRYF